MTKTVLIAGATGYLGRFLVEEYMERKGWDVVALVRDAKRSPKATKVVEVQVTKPESLTGIMDGVDIVVSAMGITRQRDGLTYQQVDYQANKNLLDEAIRAQVPHFCYIHVLKGDKISHLPAIQAKQDFVNELHRSVEDQRIQKATVICPSGFFSDMKDFLYMAKNGRAYLFGDGEHRLNPIHGKDLAKATADAIDSGRSCVEIGGPDIFTQKELAELAFDVLGKHPARISFLWDNIRTSLIAILPWITPLSVYGPAQFFFTVMGMDMVGDCHGDHHLRDFFAKVIQEEH
mmetsp:Transcript_10114/g.19453  ORF Transcript_10114/g.19453 Transcript_10114/m.19453 type:complete len:290 (-) Transcript_10114:116-985(-)